MTWKYWYLEHLSLRISNCKLYHTTNWEFWVSCWDFELWTKKSDSRWFPQNLPLWYTNIQQHSQLQYCLLLLLLRQSQAHFTLFPVFVSLSFYCLENSFHFEVPTTLSLTPTNGLNNTIIPKYWEIQNHTNIPFYLLSKCLKVDVWSIFSS